MAILYFLKLNINKEIHKVHRDNNNLLKDKVLKELYKELSVTEHVMEKNNTFIDNFDSKEKVRTIVYDMDIFFKDDKDKVIAGDFIKSNPLFATQRDDNNRFITVPVENHDAIRFFFDIRNEIITFYTTQRFGRKQFQRFFEDYINEVISIKHNKLDNSGNIIIKQHFVLTPITFRYTLEEFYESLLDKGQIQELHFSIIPPNASEEFLSELDKEAQMKLDEFSDANITGINEGLFSASGFNMDSEVIRKKFIEFDKLNKRINSNIMEENKELSANYVKAEAKNINREFFSTTEHDYTREIGDESKNEHLFIKVCKRYIEDVLRRLF